MIPLLSIFKFLSFIFSTIITLKLRQSWKKNPKDEVIRAFYRFFFYFSFSLFFFSIPPLQPNLKLVQISLYLANFFTLLMTAYFAEVVLIFTYFRKIKNILFWSIMTIAFGEIIFDVIYFQPALTLTYNFGNFNFIGWTLNFPVWLMVIHGTMAIFFITLGFILFLIKSFTQPAGYLKTRSFLLAIGFFVIIFAPVGFYFFGYLTPLSLWKELIHGSSTLVSLIFLTAGIFYKKEN